MATSVVSVPPTATPPAPAARVACLGEALVVLVAEPGQLEDSAAFERSIGGAELNTAIGLAAAGIPPALLTAVGDDGFGRHLLARAGELGVDTSAVRIDPARATGMYVKERGGGSGLANDLPRGVSRMHYYRAGSAASALDAGYLREAAVRAILDGAQAVHVTGITPALSSATLALTRAVRASAPRALLSFDVNWRPALWRGREREGAGILHELAAGSDLVLLGAEEARIVAGSDDPDAVRRALPGPRRLVVKHDGGAVTAFDEAASRHLRPDAVTITEAIGAGDAFAAGFLAAVLDGGDLDAALARGHRLAERVLRSTRDHAALDPTGAVIS
jgi:2-dehydro-3-deoxygluconokinase